MSKIGKAKIEIPEGVTVSLNEGLVLVEGPKGKLSVNMMDGFEVKIEGSELFVVPTEETKKTQALWGTFRALIQNAVIGVSKGYEKKLIVEGVGFKVALEGDKLAMQLGFSHPVHFAIPSDLNVAVDKNTITISGIDKDLVGRTAADIRALKKPEPYKGKGIRYEDEVIRRKVGKKTVG